MPPPTRPTSTSSTVTQTLARPTGLKVKTHIKAGFPPGPTGPREGLIENHNQTLVPAPRPTAGLKVKTHIKAGAQLGKPKFED